MSDLHDEFLARFEELVDFYIEIQNVEGQQALEMRQQLMMILDSGAHITLLLDDDDIDSGEIASVLKEWLYAATSTLLHNGRPMKLKDDQKVENQEEENEIAKV